MDKLTDLQLCKRIAEIEGIAHQIKKDGFLGETDVVMADLNNHTGLSVYNPLAKYNRGLLFDLMVKHLIEVHYDYNNCVTYRDGVEVSLIQFSCNSDIPRAILECIIEAKS